MFKKWGQGAEKVKIYFEGECLETENDQSVAAALLGNNIPVFRQSAESGEPRSAYCMMGVCFECMVEIDGLANQQSCMTPVREGMTIKRQKQPVME